jgi:hypothetical protein
MAGHEVLIGHLTTLETMIAHLYAMIAARQPDAEYFIEQNRDRQIDIINAADDWPLEAQVAGEECAKRVARLAIGNLAQLRGTRS